MNESEIRIADLFGGVGGFRLGIERAINLRPTEQEMGQTDRNSLWRGTSKTEQGISCVFYSEIDKYAVQTYNKNFKENHKATDIRTTEADSLPDIDWVCGGFPCQAFSIAGKRRGFNDTRGTLFFEIARIIKAKRPKIVFLENVKGLLNHEGGKTFSTIIQTISELGYDVQWMVLNSKFFGVPQNRERVFIIGSLRGTGRPEILPFGEVKESFNKQFKKENFQAIDVYNKKMRNEIPTLSDPCHNSIRITSHSPRTNDPKKGGSGPLISNKHCFTIDRTPHYVNNIRRLTPIECERLQGFPDNWTEGVSDTQRYKQMGNAVTVNVIQAIAEKLLKTSGTL